MPLTAALPLLTMWLPPARHFEAGITRQLIPPATALAVTVCTFPGRWAVFATGIVAASAVVVGTASTARVLTRQNRRQNRTEVRDA
jgi:hypothetical protein